MAETAEARPLSPHIWQWRCHITMLASILHRFTGIVLYAAMMGLVVWLGALAAGQGAYDWLMGLVPPWLIALKLSALCAILTYHLLNGVRHLFWDAGKGLSPATANLTAWLVIFLAFAAFAGPAALIALRHG